MILSFLFYVFVFYLGYKLLFDFIIPVFKTTLRVRKGFRQMHEQMKQHTDQHSQQQAGQFQSQASAPKPPADKEDYIDFEEVK